MSSSPKKAALWFGASIYFNSALLLVATPLFTRYLSTAEYGEVTLFTTWTNIIALLSTLSLSKGIFQNALLEFESEQDRYIASTLGLMGTLTIVVATCFCLVTNLIGNFTGLRASLLVYAFVYTLFLAVFQIWQSAERFHYRYKAVVAVSMGSAILGAPLSVLLLIGLQHQQYTVEYRVIGGTISTFLVGCWLYYHLIKKGGGFYNRKHWKYALIYAVPLLPHYIAQTLVQQFDRISMERLFSHSTLGIYGLAATVASGITLFWTAINTTYTPWSLRKLREGDIAKLRATSNKLVLAVTGVSSAFSLAAPEIVAIISPASYHEAAKAAPLLITASAIQFFASLYLTGEFSAKRSRVITFNSLSAAALTGFFLFALLPIYGWLFAAVTQAASQLLQLAVFRSARKIRDEKEIVSTAVLFLALAGLATSCWITIYESSTIRWYALGVLSFCGVMVARKPLLLFFETRRDRVS